jgi:hypothetical protein
MRGLYNLWQLKLMRYIIHKKEIKIPTRSKAFELFHRVEGHERFLIFRIFDRE